MKKIIQIGLCLLSIIINAQESNLYNIIAEYEIYYNTEIPNVKIGKLIINKNLDKSIFLYGKNESENKKNDDGKNIVLQYKSSERFNFFDFSINELISKEKVFNEEYLINEKVPAILWNLELDEKEIGNLKVKKATTFYRGRNYTAWYSLEYPIKFGPWKFQGLPGLIIEIYDESNRYHWLMKSLKKEYIHNATPFIINEKNIKEIDIREFVKLRYDSKAPLINESKLPRGTIVEFKKIKRNGIELIYEWEH
jgi:GLPGLI family protein